MIGVLNNSDFLQRWPESASLAPAVNTLKASDREIFIKETAANFNDDESFARERWNAAMRMLVHEDMNGLPEDWDCNAHLAPPRTRAAWLLTPRELFIPKSHRQFAYRSSALPLSDGQTISAPYMVTRMTAALNPTPEHRVLEIGTGSGYQAAMLAVLSPHVHTIERVSTLASRADALFAKLTKARPWIGRIRRKMGSGYQGWEEGAPYHRIMVTCAIDHIPPALLEQLAPRGLLILPLGPAGAQRLLAVRRARDAVADSPGKSDASGKFQKLEILDVYGDGTRVMFVPFVP